MKKLIAVISFLVLGTSAHAGFLDYTGYRYWNDPPFSATNPTHPQLAAVYDVGSGRALDGSARVWASNAEVLDMMLSLTGGETSGPTILNIFKSIEWNYGADPFGTHWGGSYLTGYTRDGLAVAGLSHYPSWDTGSIYITGIPVSHDISFGNWTYTEILEPSTLWLFAGGLFGVCVVRAKLRVTQAESSPVIIAAAEHDLLVPGGRTTRCNGAESICS